MNPLIFREYDIRGLVEQDLTPDTVERIGKAIGTFIRRQGGQTLTLGWDVRGSSETFREILGRAFNATGCNVIEIGRVSTPVSYFSLHHLQPDGGVMITGSHNPAEYNGFKISCGTQSLYGENIQALKRLIEKEDFESGSGSTRREDIDEAYITAIKQRIRFERPVKVVVDGGNGCFGLLGPRLLRELGLEPIEQFCEPDGAFPNHHPDPTVEKYMVPLMERVTQESAELGIGFDGDMDRLGVVDEGGRLMWGDQLLILFAREVLKNHPGTAVVGEVKCSQNLYDDIRKHGGQPVMSAAGHSLIKKKMKETRALLAGEMSGHMCFADDYFGYDDALYAACRLLRIVANSPTPLSAMLADLPPAHNTPEIRIDCPDDLKFQIVQELTETFRQDHEVIDIDGVRVNFQGGWALVRASNTQPVLVLRAEAQSPERLDEIKAHLMKKLERYAPAIKVEF